MIRTIRRFAITVAVASLSFGSFSLAPAEAAQAACSGVGLMELSPPLPAAPASTTSSFVAHISVGYCAPALTGLWMNGTLTGNCTVFTGSGTANGQPFSLTAAGAVITLHGPAVYGSFVVLLDTFCDTFGWWTLGGSIVIT